MSWAVRISVLGCRPSVRDLNEMTSLCHAGEVKPVIDKVFPLEEAANAFALLGAGRVNGKAAVTIGGSQHILRFKKHIHHPPIPAKAGVRSPR